MLLCAILAAFCACALGADYPQISVPDLPQELQELIPKPIARFCAGLNHDQRKLVWKLNDDYVDLDHFMKGLKEADESLFEKLNPTYLDYCKKVEALPVEAQMFTYRSSIRFLMDIIRVEGKMLSEKQLKAYSWLLANRFSKLEEDSKNALREAFPEYFKVLEGEEFQGWAQDPYA